MKRIQLLSLFLLLLSMTPLGAVSITHLHMGLGNDWYTMGLGDNLDDGLSFGGHLMVTAKDIASIKVDALGFTDRLRTERRYDQVNINVYTPFSFTADPFIFIYTPLIGVSVEGNLGFDTIQNGLHERIDRPKLTLDYDKQESTAHLNLGSTAQILFPFRWVKLGLELSYLHTFGWEDSTQAVGLIKLGDSLTIKAGYSFMQDFDDKPAHSDMVKRFTGPTYSYYFDGGLVTNSWVYHQQSGSSYGVFGIDVMQLFQPKTYESSEFVYSLGILYDMQGHQNRLFSLAFDHFIIQTRHKSGPLYNDMDNQEKRMTVASLVAGYQQQWQATPFIYPYLKGLGGFQRLNLQEHFTEVKIEEIRPTLLLELGVRFGRDGQWVTQNNSYRPRLSATLQYVFWTQSIREKDAYFAPHVGPWLFLVGIGLDIGNDPH